MKQVFLGIGSNIDAEANLHAAALLIRREWPGAVFSGVYETAPLLAAEQNTFLNAVARIETEETPPVIQTKLQAIEKHLKKDPPYRYGPRTIDLDILLIDDQTVNTEMLTVPHPRMHERRFVLEPLLELVGEDAQHPVLQEAFTALLGAQESQESTRTDIVL